MRSVPFLGADYDFQEIQKQNFCSGVVLGYDTKFNALAQQFRYDNS